MLAQIAKPYLLLVGDEQNAKYVKTACGLRDWAPEACLAQLRFTEQAVDLRLPQMSPREAAAAGAKTLVIGIAAVGGGLPESWRHTIVEALNAGLDVAAGLHQRLADIPEFAQTAARLGRQLHDVRHSDTRFSVGTGVRRSGLRLLTVGTDCALGKKYTALAITKAMRETGIAADFRATGQTGILISGRGVAVDAVVADFIAGAAEALSPENSADHWDVIEGQGSLFHPAYAGVTLGLLHGSQPDALVLCHDPTRECMLGFPHMPMVSLEQAMPPYLLLARRTNPDARFVGISLNTSSLSAGEATGLLQRTSRTLGLPCIDPIRTGARAIVSALEHFNAH